LSGVGVCTPVKGGWDPGRFVGFHTPLLAVAGHSALQKLSPHILKVHPGLTPPGGLISCPVTSLPWAPKPNEDFFFFQPFKFLPLSGISSALSLEIVGQSEI
ncbi:pyridoxal (pyridoxine, vitamin B6) phosphatase, partial [Mus musculus]